MHTDHTAFKPPFATPQAAQLRAHTLAISFAAKATQRMLLGWWEVCVGDVRADGFQVRGLYM